MNLTSQTSMGGGESASDFFNVHQTLGTSDGKQCKAHPSLICNVASFC